MSVFFGFLRAGELTVPSDKEFDPASHLCFSEILIDDTFNPQLDRSFWERRRCCAG